MQYEAEQLEHMNCIIKNQSGPWDEQVGDEQDDGCHEDNNVVMDEIEDNVRVYENVDVY